MSVQGQRCGSSRFVYEAVAFEHLGGCGMTLLLQLFFFFLTCWPVPDSLIIFRRFSVLNNYFNKLNIRVSFNVLFLSYVISELPDFPARLVSD